MKGLGTLTGAGDNLKMSSRLHAIIGKGYLQLNDIKYCIRLEDLTINK